MLYYADRISDNIRMRNPEGYLICANVPIARSGTQDYYQDELGQDGEDALVAQFFVLEIFCLVESVGVQQDRRPADILQHLAFKIPTATDSDGSIGQARHEGRFFLQEDGRIMAAVAELQPAGLQVQLADEERHEHELLILLGDAVVDLAGHLGRRKALTGKHTEQAERDGHEQARRDPLTAYVSDTEVQLVILNEIFIQVSAHFLGRRHEGIQVDFLSFREGRELIGNQRHLDIPGNLEFSFDTLLLGCGRGQFIDIVHKGFLHVIERLRQDADLVRTMSLGQSFGKITAGDGTGLYGEGAERFQLLPDDA